mmetsp:Transcript_4295/g.12388  ORF Transcript_4295/g.12388 Transcript_4295/m.12388 type:complete len:371 (-) Transcript_4295:122-1234(-)
MSSEDDDDDLPAWITNHKSPSKQSAYKAVIQLSDSDTDSDIAAEPAPPAAEPAPGHQSELVAATAAPVHANPSPSASRSKSPKKAAAAEAKSAESPPKSPVGRKTAAGSKLSAPRVSASTATTASAAAETAARKTSEAGGNAATVAAAAEAARRLSQTNAEPGPSQAAADASPDVAVGMADGGPAPTAKALPQPMLAAVAGELPVVLSEKLSTIKAIAELDTLEGGQTDLTGDSGAVGRVLVKKTDDGGHHMQFDLKGIMYDARHAALPGTLMVVNINQCEAKVETLLGSFLQLHRTSAFGDDEEDHKYFMDEDEDNYQYDPAYAIKAAEGGDAKRPKKKESKPRAKARSVGGVRKKKPTAKRKPAAKRK